jgi:hypothetical protein
VHQKSSTVLELGLKEAKCGARLHYRLAVANKYERRRCRAKTKAIKKQNNNWDLISNSTKKSSFSNTNKTTTMVVLEAAAITAGGVAAYHGGKKAAVESAKKIKHKMKLSKEEKDRKETFDSRKKERSERFANINKYRQDVSQSVKNKSTMPKFNWGNNKAADDAKSRHSARSTTTSASAHSAKWWEK